MGDSVALSQAGGRRSDPGRGGTARDLARELAALRPRMKAVALRLVASSDAADDVVQSAFEKALRKHAQFDGRAQLSTWLHRIVVNEALMWLRSEGRRRRRFEPLTAEAGRARADSEPETALLLRERAQELHRQLARLPASERAVIEACALGDTRYADYAAHAGIGADAVKSRAFRARQRLRGWLVLS